MSDEVRTVVSLDGQWDLAFDPENVGKQEEWFARFPRSVKMQVPGVWEQIKPGYDGVGWYRRSFDVPEEWPDKTIRLRFWAACYYSEVWLNGEYLGDHESGYTPFEFDISKGVRVGPNEVVVRIINPPIDREIEGLRAGGPLHQSDVPTGKAGWYFNFGGIWQEVELIVTDRTFVEDVFAKPYPSKKKAVLEVTARNGRRAGDYELTCTIAPWKQQDKPEITKTVKARLKKGATTVTVPMAFDNVHLWSPDDPFLYVATVTLSRDGRVRDRQTVRFGMRTFTIKGGSFHLNGKKVRLMGFLQQGMYPRTLCYPETRELALKELKAVKDNGFNFIRQHLKPTNPWYLDLCDEIGLLNQGEPPTGWNCKSPHFERRLLTEMVGMLRRDRNHASVVFWCLLNEAYSNYGWTEAETRRLTARVARKALAVDDTRLMLDTSGKLGHQPGGDGSVAFLPNSKRTVKVWDVHSYCFMPLQDSSLERYRTMGSAGTALYVSEFGAPFAPPDFEEVIKGYTPEERKLGLEDFVLHQDFYDSLNEKFQMADLAGTFGDVRTMIAESNRVRADEMRHVTGAMRVNSNIAGFAMCQLADASGELFGALDVWRKPKELLRQYASAVQTPLLIPEVAPRVAMPGDTVNVRVCLVNETKVGPECGYRIDVMKPRGRKAIRSFSGKVKAAREVQVVVKERLTVDMAPGKYVVRARLMQGGKVLTDQSMEFTVLPLPKLEVDRVAARDYHSGCIRKFLGKFGVELETFSHNYHKKDVPLLLDMRGGLGRNSRREFLGELQKIVQLGGAAVLFGAEALQLYGFLFPKPIQVQGVMRTIGYVKEHPIVAGLPSNCVVGYEYGDVYVHELDKGEDVLAIGGQPIIGGLSQHMWTRPACFYWGVNLYTVPIGRGHVIVCNMAVLDHLETNRTAQLMMANLVNYAASIIKPGGEEKLLNRGIDPLKPEDYS